jgi:hypothetical protein
MTRGVARGVLSIENCWAVSVEKGAVVPLYSARSSSDVTDPGHSSR